MSEQTPIGRWLESQRAAQTRFLAELVKVPSDNPPGDCAAHAERAAALLEEMGFAVERHPVPAELVRANGMVSATNLVVRRRFGDGPVVALNAHGDVVPPGRGWTRDPFGAEIVDGWMYGRGVAVSKSDFATYAFALKALEQLGTPLAGTVELHLTYDEEAGGEIGPRWLLEQGITRPDCAIAAGFSYAVVTAHNGCLHLEVEVAGKSAHAALPATGVDALEAATHLLGALYAHRQGYAATVSAIPGIGSPQLTVGLIQGGINTNVVPDRITFRLDRRMIPEENGAAVEAELRNVLETAAAAFPRAQVRVRRILLAEPLKPTAATDRLAALLCRHAEAVMGEPVAATGVPLYTDARHYAAAGVPIALYGAGPRSIEEANAHRADERLPLSDLFKATEVVALTLRDLLRA
ncbi:M20/M25/M40 family metallo-hydrolase [Azospirillum sp. ST 5-10]|uniref:M20/M25/M40 family metallo-hydrolase n=1 Tax=unclassified Azospirillum TaxID=2630922 RepID=UPI003F4A7327